VTHLLDHEDSFISEDLVKTNVCVCVCVCSSNIGEVSLQSDDSGLEETEEEC